MKQAPSYLRVSVTDRCDLHCVYCRPRADPARQEHHSLTRAEVVRFVRAASACGVTKVRLTGGEPLLHKDIISIVRKLSSLGAVRFLGLTTNGQQLAPVAQALHRAGLQSVNISLPSLAPEVYRRVTGGVLGNVLAGLEAALRAGFAPVKLNVVVLRGINDGEVAALASLARRDPVEVRFIECMPFRHAPQNSDLFVPAAEVLPKLQSLGRLSPQPSLDPSSSATRFAIRGFRGVVALIAPMTRPFCRKCNRIRLTADRRLRACLVDAGELDARRALSGGADAEAVRELIEKTMMLKPRLHSERFCGAMARIGG